MNYNKIQFLLKITALLALGLCTSATQAATLQVSNQNFEESLNKTIIDAQTGDTIQMPEGRFSMSNELLINKPGLILRGQGPNKTVLSFKNQKAGPQGILGTKNQLVLSNFAVEDTAGNAIKVVGSDGVIFDKLRITWTGGPKETNGSYGIYPVLTKNVLIQDCDVSGASDAGLYVGQSDRIIVRRNYVHGNVAGLEIENSSNADVYENRATHNTVGLLVFNLPDLLVKTGHNIRFYRNQSNDNNLENFSTPGSIINLVPKGAGMLVLAAKKVEIFDNEFLRNKLTGISFNNYLISERKITDAQYDPTPKGIHIFNNRISKGSLPLPDFKIPDLSKLSLDSLKLSASDRTTLIFKLLLGPITPSIITDGIMDGTYAGAKPAVDDQICIYANADEKNNAADFGNLHLDSPNKIFGLPAGPATRDQGPHRCVLQRLAAVQLPEMQIEPGHEPRPTPEEINSFCKNNSSGADQVNLAALAYDCPLLSDYNFFKNANQATVEPNSNGFNFKPSSELFTDYSEKSRYVFVPGNQKINFTENQTFDYPVGTVLAKTFSVRILGANKQVVLKPIEYH
jgi:parallel beta-helix repeat protein